MMLRWVAAGVLEAVKGFRRLKGMPTCPDSSSRFVPAINASASVSQRRTSRRISTEPPPNFNSGRDIPGKFSVRSLCLSAPVVNGRHHATHTSATSCTWIPVRFGLRLIVSSGSVAGW